MRLPIRLRLTLISGALMAGVLIALGSFLYLRLESDLRAVVDEALQDRAMVVLADLAAGRRLGENWPVEPDEAFAQIVAPDGRILEATSGFSDASLLPAEASRVARGFQISEGEVVTSEGPIPVRLLATRTADGNLLVIGMSLEDQRDALTRLATLLLIGGPVAVALASLAGWVVAGAALRPVERLRREAEAVSGSEPNRRLEIPATADELARLAESLNRMLARLEEALTRERRFVSDASHELRTPLANLKAELDLALRRARSPDELTDALRSAALETDRLIRLSEDLLVLARTEQGRLSVRRTETDLTQLVRDTVVSFGPRAGELGIRLQDDLAPGVTAEVDGLRIQQALGNLVDNALRHTPKGGEVNVRLLRDEGEIRIEVADTGNGFEEGFVSSAFEPFTRSDAARGRTRGGAGLGLAIVRAVAQAHAGTVETSNRPQGGAMVTMHLPR